jgi:hypothetical protein
MSLLDDEFLGTLLHETADSFAVPASGASDTLRRVHQGDDERAKLKRSASDTLAVAVGANDGGSVDARTAAPLLPRVGETIRSHRLLAAAACVVVVLALAGGGAALLGGTGTTPVARTASKAVSMPPTVNRHGPGVAGNAVTTTTSPNLSYSASAPLQAANSPTQGAAGTPNPTKSAGAADAAGTLVLPAGAVGQPAKIEQTGSLNLTVARGTLSKSMTKLSTLAATYNGFVANSQTQLGASAGDSPSGTVTLEIPVANFGSVLKTVEALGKPSSVTTKATDVTAQYVDLQSRITALQASRGQYLTIMTKASSVGDVLAVQAQLDSLQSQIEQLQGQQAVLDSETAYSTLITSFTEAGPHHHHAVTTPSESGALKAWHDSVHGFATGVNGIIRIAGPALFALLCLVVLLVGGRLTWRRLQRHNL